MLKRLIEVALPLKEVSEQSAREKSIRHGHISTLHIWWARRPLAACRAAVFASLIPDPDHPECPESFRKLVRELLGRSEFKPKNGDGSTVEDTPRNRCLEFIKHLVKWENSNARDYIEPASKLIAAAHKFLHSDAEGDVPKILDPFAGGGAIPLEALRLGCETYAIDLNPVAHLIELCTLVYPQKYGQPDSRPVPDYIKRLVALNRTKKKGKSALSLFDEPEASVIANENDFVPNIEITQSEYRKSPLAADVKYWGRWVLDKARVVLSPLFPLSANGKEPVAYFWARTVKCESPTCGATIPLLRQTWIARSPRRKIAFEILPDQDAKRCKFQVFHDQHIQFDPAKATMQQGSVICPFCKTVASGVYLRKQACSGKMGVQLVISSFLEKGRQKSYEVVEKSSGLSVDLAQELVTQRRSSNCYGTVPWLPTEVVPSDRPAPNSRGLSGVQRYGADVFFKLFSTRQLAVLVEFAAMIRAAIAEIVKVHDPEYARAVSTYLAFALSKLADRNSANCIWRPQTEAMGHSFSRQALQMVWDYIEISPFDDSWGWMMAFNDFEENILRLSGLNSLAATCSQASASALPHEDSSIDGVITDPPYYESVPYGDLSDFFYVWLRRCIGDLHPKFMSTPLTPKGAEIIAY